MSDEEDEDVDIVLPEGEDELDENLREAMRQSLLEQRLEKERKAMEENFVDRINVSSDKEAPSIIPCRPEAYLRHMVNSSFEMTTSKFRKNSMMQQVLHAKRRLKPARNQAS